MVEEFLLSLSGPWRALCANIGTSSLRNRLRGCDAAEVAEMTLRVRFRLFSDVGPLTDFGVSGLMATSEAGLGSAGANGERWGVIDAGGGAGIAFLCSICGSGGVMF